MSADDHGYDGYIAQAKVTKGGHLHIGRGGFTLCFGSSRLSGYDSDDIKHLCVAAQLPVIDSRPAPIELVIKLSVNGPMIAVNAEPDPYPWHALSYVPLGAIAAAYRRAGVEVLNVEESTFDERGFVEPPCRSLAASRLPEAQDRLVAVIRSLDGTWHRPFTTLELAALQSLVDPEEQLELDGLSDAEWRERIGNAVPPEAAKAIADTMGTTLLFAWSGESFMLSAMPIWVRNLAVGLSVSQVPMP